MAVFEVKEEDISFKWSWNARKNVMQALGEFQYYIKGTPSALVQVFAKNDVISASVSKATFDALTGVQMITQLKTAITNKLEALPGGAHTVEFV